MWQMYIEWHDLPGLKKALKELFPKKKVQDDYYALFFTLSDREVIDSPKWLGELAKKITWPALQGTSMACTITAPYLSFYGRVTKRKDGEYSVAFNPYPEFYRLEMTAEPVKLGKNGKAGSMAGQIASHVGGVAPISYSGEKSILTLKTLVVTSLPLALRYLGRAHTRVLARMAVNIYCCEDLVATVESGRWGLLVDTSPTKPLEPLKAVAMREVTTKKAEAAYRRMQEAEGKARKNQTDFVRKLAVRKGLRILDNGCIAGNPVVVGEVKKMGGACAYRAIGCNGCAQLRAVEVLGQRLAKGVVPEMDGAAACAGLRDWRVGPANLEKGNVFVPIA